MYKEWIDKLHLVQQLKELTDKYRQYLSEDVLTIDAYNFIQLSLVRINL